MKGLTLSFEIVSPVSQPLSEGHGVSIGSEMFLSLPVDSYPRDTTAHGSVTVGWLCPSFSCGRMQQPARVSLNCCLVLPGAPGAAMRLRQQRLGAAWSLDKAQSEPLQHPSPSPRTPPDSRVRGPASPFCSVLEAEAAWPVPLCMARLSAGAGCCARSCCAHSQPGPCTPVLPLLLGWFLRAHEYTRCLPAWLYEFTCLSTSYGSSCCIIASPNLSCLKRNCGYSSGCDVVSPPDPRTGEEEGPVCRWRGFTSGGLGDTRFLEMLAELRSQDQGGGPPPWLRAV